MVVAVVVETFGGIGTRAMRAFKFAARRAGCKKRGRDGTKYMYSPRAPLPSSRTTCARL